MKHKNITVSLAEHIHELLCLQAQKRGLSRAGYVTFLILNDKEK